MRLKLKQMYYNLMLYIFTFILMLGISMLIDLLSWEFMNINYKKKLISEYTCKIALDLELDTVPNVEFYSEEPNKNDIVRKGYYSNKAKKININTRIFNYTKNECVNTLAHEVLHYWQYNKANIGETEYAVEMRNNITDYKDKKINSNENYVEYRIHPIEKQARAYAKRFEQKYIINRLAIIIKLNVEIYTIVVISINIVKIIYRNLRGVKHDNRCNNRKSTLPRNKRV